MTHPLSDCIKLTCSHLKATYSESSRRLQAGISALKAPVLTVSARKEDPLALKVFHRYASMSFLCGHDRARLWPSPQSIIQHNTRITEICTLAGAA